MSESGLPSGTVTFLFTDIEGSTRLWEDYPEAMHDVLARHDEIVRGAIESHGGHVVKTTGDGFHAVFATARDALGSAVSAQQLLAAEQPLQGVSVKVRMGVHTGEARAREGDYYGSSLNRAARLMGVGHGGQIVCSEATADLARDVLAEGVALVDLGEHRLRDLSRAERVFQVTAPGLPHDFPSLTSLDAFPGNLPVQMSSFVGRERELARVAQALGDARVVTLTGMGGVGKTRLALQAAAEVLPRFREGAWLVELAPVRDPDGVVDAVAAVFGVNARAGQSVEESLVEFLRTKQLLLVVDNCEHLLEAVGDLVETLEHACAGLVVLATSREGLSLDGEQNLTVPSLSAPATADLEAVASSDAVVLFTQRAQRVDADFAVTEQNALAVAQVCRRLDGVPLAIELAAAQVAVMTPAELVAGLERRFETLAGGRRRAVQRHQTLRAAIDWSFDLCSEPEQRLLARLAVFAGGCTREAAEAICVGDPVEGRGVFPLLRSLVAKSLVVAERAGTETRYRLLETIREYGEEQLAAHDETEVLRSRHAKFYCEFCRQVSEEIWGPHQIDAAKRFGTEHENVLAALNYAIDTGNADLALQIVRNVPDVEVQVGYELVIPFEAVWALPGAPDHPLYPHSLAEGAFGLSVSHEIVAAERRFEQAVAAAARVDADALLDWRLSGIGGTLAIARGEHDIAATFFERSNDVARGAGLVGLAAYSLGSAAFEAVLAGDADTAKRLASDGLALARQAGTPSTIVMNLHALAGALAGEDPAHARALLGEAVQLRVSLGYETQVESVQALIVSACLEQWPETLGFAGPAIRLYHWTNSWMMLGAVNNVVARAVAPIDAETAAVIQGIAHHFALSDRIMGAVSVTPGSSPTSSARTGLITQMRRTTTGLLIDALGEQRMRGLRGQGDAMENDHAVAYVLDSIARAAAVTSPAS